MVSVLRIRDDQGVELDLPDHWAETAAVGDAGLIAAEPLTAGFRANVVLVSASTGTSSFRQWQHSVDSLLSGVLNNYEIIDLESCPVAGFPGGRRLAQYTADRGDYLTMEQWFTMDSAEVGHTLTATVETYRYSQLAPSFRKIAGSLTLPGCAA